MKNNLNVSLVNKKIWRDSIKNLSVEENLFINWNWLEAQTIIGKEFFPFLIYNNHELIGLICYTLENKNILSNLIPFKYLLCGGREEKKGYYLKKEFQSKEHFLKIEKLCLKEIKNIIAKTNNKSLFTVIGYYEEDENKLNFLKRKISISKITKTNTIILNLKLDEETLFKNLDKKHRNVIKQADSRGVIVKKMGIDELDLFFHLKKPSWKQIKPYWIDHKDKFESYYSHCINNGILDFYIASVNYSNNQGLEKQEAKINTQNMNSSQKDVAIIAIYKSGKSAIYHEGGMDKEFQWYRPNNLLLWEAMLNLKESDIETFDLGGINLTTKDKALININKFKFKFGGANKQVTRLLKIKLF